MEGPVMLSLIEVQCPHCNAKGQIILPPIGALIIGPCPECKELVLIFMGRCLGLDREIIQQGSIEAKREHVLEVMTDYLRERIVKVIGDPEENQPSDMIDAAELPPAEEVPAKTSGKSFLNQTPDEIRREVDQVDNPDFFKKTFEA